MYNSKTIVEPKSRKMIQCRQYFIPHLNVLRHIPCGPLLSILFYELGIV